MNIEHQRNPAIFPGSDWIEIDHHSDAVSSDPEIKPEVLEHFEVVLDPSDEWNKWAVPKPNTALLEVPLLYDEEGTDFRYRYPFVTSEGEESLLVYEDDPSGQEHRTVRIETDGQLVFKEAA